ncbi:induced myeloid leukemia cell differentiation protein Mcl-1 homolog [Phyllopteryx taeniolatus]|uniref:induced myeloid leukemia cell differentiation protein Mcl-1 homolog n=1 Tax=Phyllopteryx taeniolatus TaxID=161469 RepID=UPI002AD39A7C|nr:induced myeloid leukemia cell differentiation protein Mcl-1 homolog [Phyllopteryx taeniolatus]
MPTTRRLMWRNSKLGITATLMLPPNAVLEGVAFPQPQPQPQPQPAAAVNAKVGTRDSPKPGPGAQPEVKRRPEGPPQPPPQLRTPADPDVLRTDTRRLIGRFLSDFTGLTTATWIQSKAQSTMKRVVAGLVDKHSIRYNGIISQLALDGRGHDMAFVSEVARILFGDGTTNWGRVASLVAFAAVVSRALKEKRRESCVELVAQEVSTYLLSHQRTWLVQHNAWDGFAEFFEEDDLESRLRNVLSAFVGLACVAAALLRLSQ